MRPFPLLAVLFFIMPLIEVYLFVQIGGVIGGWPTVGLVVLTAVLGVTLLRWQGLATLTRLQANLERRQLPAFELVEAVLLLVGGALLLTPGFFTDTLGFLCLLPPSRQVLVRALLARVRVRMRPAGPERQADDGRVIEGEFTRRRDK